MFDSLFRFVIDDPVTQRVRLLVKDSDWLSDSVVGYAEIPIKVKQLKCGHVCHLNEALLGCTHNVSLCHEGVRRDLCVLLDMFSHAGLLAHLIAHYCGAFTVYLPKHRAHHFSTSRAPASTTRLDSKSFRLKRRSSLTLRYAYCVMRAFGCVSHAPLLCSPPC